MDAKTIDICARYARLRCSARTLEQSADRLYESTTAREALECLDAIKKTLEIDTEETSADLVLLRVSADLVPTT
jgi:NTP pyrophosphatase (non-canonical NTP hydrolase)